MSMIDNDWLPAIKGEYSKPYYKELFTFVKDEYSKYVVYPPADDIFNAFHFTPLSKVKVLILGQDPYHNVHQAHGLSFSVLPGEEAPPSLKNIYKELHDDCGCYIPNNGYLKKWADQGVLLLNTVLTVRAHQANSHQGHGWSSLRMQLLMLSICRTDLLCICCGVRLHRERHQCLIIRNILFLKHHIRVRYLRTEAFWAADISASAMNF